MKVAAAVYTLASVVVLTLMVMRPPREYCQYNSRGSQRPCAGGCGCGCSHARNHASRRPHCGHRITQYTSSACGGTFAND